MNPQSTASSQERAGPTLPERLTSVVSLLVREMTTGLIGPGEQAALRRNWNLGAARAAAELAFWKIVVRVLEPQELYRDRLMELPLAELERRWRVILAAIATLYLQHSSPAQLGAALAQAGLSEHRILRVLKAEGAGLEAGVRALVHQLASSGTRVNLAELAEIVFFDGSRHDDQIRRRVALSYYRAREATEKTSGIDHEREERNHE